MILFNYQISRAGASPSDGFVSRLFIGRRSHASAEMQLMYSITLADRAVVGMTNMIIIMISE